MNHRRPFAVHKLAVGTLAVGTVADFDEVVGHNVVVAQVVGHSVVVVEVLGPALAETFEPVVAGVLLALALSLVGLSFQPVDD